MIRFGKLDLAKHTPEHPHHITAGYASALTADEADDRLIIAGAPGGDRPARNLFQLAPRHGFGEINIGPDVPEANLWGTEILPALQKSDTGINV